MIKIQRFWGTFMNTVIYLSAADYEQTEGKSDYNLALRNRPYQEEKKFDFDLISCLGDVVT